MKCIDLFAGIGGIRLGFEQAFDNDLETVFVSEIDKFARKMYSDNFYNTFEISEDIRDIDVNNIPNFDICMAGFPCQAFSIAGKQEGFKDQIRGTLFAEIVRVCEAKQPKVIFCENVPNLIKHDKCRTFKTIVKAFEEIGYNVYPQLLNAKDFGCPQNRERVYIVCFRKDLNIKDFYIEPPTVNPKVIRDILEDAPISSKFYLSNQYLDCLRKHRKSQEEKGNGYGYVVRDLDSIAATIVCGGMGHERNLICDPRPHSMVPVTSIKGGINKEDIRKMTPREWARLQGFPENFRITVSDTRAYKLLANSVAVPVVREIAQHIKEVLEKCE